MFSTKLRDVEVEFRCRCVMGMASVSQFYLFNIQVRANCTTACNRQAALQYVELTHIFSSVSFFFLYLFRFTKMCMQLGTGSEVMLAPPLWEGSGIPTDQPDWLLSHSERFTRETVSDSSFLFLSLFSWTKNWTEPIMGLFPFCLIHIYLFSKKLNFLL